MPAEKTKELGVWRIVSRVPIPHSVTVIPSSGPGTLTYAQTKYKVLEERDVIGVGGKTCEVREHEEWSPALYAHDRPDLRTHFSVALVVLPKLERECFKDEKRRREQVRKLVSFLRKG